MKKITRKEFIGSSLLAGCSLLVPKFLAGSQAGLISASHRNLVVVQLSGGNDGLNTIIPFRNDLYYSSRPTLAYTRASVLPLNETMALNPVMGALRPLYDNGEICILNSVGYPNPDRSHFRSMDIWHTASSSDQYLDTGWIGRYLDSACSDCETAHLALETDDMLGLALKGNNVKGMAVRNPSRLYQAAQDPFFKNLNAISKSAHHEHKIASYLYKTAMETSGSINYIYEKSRAVQSTMEYPDNDFGKNLKMIGGLISADCETRIYYISLSGFDTHARQKQVHERLLEIYSKGMAALVSDLKRNDRFNNTLIMSFSEFGRRVSENGSAGTDHGAANNMMLISGALKSKGIYNDQPDLANLSNGDVGYKVDFRNVYGTVLQNWLNVDPFTILSIKTKPEHFI